MNTNLPSVPESCTQCPHLDQFHNSCSHPLRQLIVRELEGEEKVCPMFSAVRADAMLALEDRLDAG